MLFLRVNKFTFKVFIFSSDQAPMPIVPFSLMSFSYCCLITHSFPRHPLCAVFLYPQMNLQGNQCTLFLARKSFWEPRQDKHLSQLQRSVPHSHQPSFLKVPFRELAEGVPGFKRFVLCLACSVLCMQVRLN